MYEKQQPKTFRTTDFIATDWNLKNLYHLQIPISTR